MFSNQNHRKCQRKFFQQQSSKREISNLSSLFNFEVLKLKIVWRRRVEDFLLTVVALSNLKRFPPNNIIVCVERNFNKSNPLGRGSSTSPPYLILRGWSPKINGGDVEHPPLRGFFSHAWYTRKNTSFK